MCTLLCDTDSRQRQLSGLFQLHSASDTAISSTTMTQHTNISSQVLSQPHTQTHRHQCAQSMSLWTVVTGSAGSLSYSHCQYLLFRMACIVLQIETVLCQSNCLCLSHLAVVRCCCRFAAVGLVARRYQSIAAQQAGGQQQSHHSGVQRPDVGSATLSADVGI